MRQYKNSLFTHKHYEFFAKMIGSDEIQLSSIELFLDMLKKDNPKFDRNRFYSAMNKERHNNMKSFDLSDEYKTNFFLGKA